MSEKLLWYNQYRPKTLDEFVWSNPQLYGLVQTWIKQKDLQNVLFAGPSGLGKTTLVELIITGLGIAEDDVLRLKGSRDNNAEAIRTKIPEFCELGGWSGLRIVFFDEADALSRVAQEALRNVIDDYSEQARFIFTCNFPHRITDAIASSRLLRIDFEKIDPDEYLERLLTILVDEEIAVTDESLPVLRAIQHVCYPDLRKGINLLQASVKDRKLRSLGNIKSSTGTWEIYIRQLLTQPSDPLAELTKLRDTLAGLSLDEIEQVYRFMYHHGNELFGPAQIKAIYIINNGQKTHGSALLPDLILLEVLLRLMIITNERES